MLSLPLVPNFIRSFATTDSTPTSQPHPNPERSGPPPYAHEDDNDGQLLNAADISASRAVDLSTESRDSRLPSTAPAVPSPPGSSFLAASAPPPSPPDSFPFAPEQSRRGTGGTAATVEEAAEPSQASVMATVQPDATEGQGRRWAETGAPEMSSDQGGGDERRPSELPEDDGMGALRGKILDVQSREIDTSEKALLMHALLMEGYTKSQLLGKPTDPATSPTVYEQPLASGPLESLKFWQLSLGEPSTPERFLLTEDDLRPTFAPHAPDGQEAAEEPRPLGCEHYRRNVKLQCFTCQKWYTCRLCHDEAETHTLPRHQTRNMLCMLCGYAQKASDECVKCGSLAARYYCGICKLWNDHPDGSYYHCHECGICRVGAGLGKDFFHCKSCGICIDIGARDTHRCREGAMDCNCPICGEYMFTSTKRMIHMNPCRHIIHKRCYDQHMLTSYKCPICNKSARNMESLFRKWDKNIEEQPMPPEWRDSRAIIYCNDCEAKSQTLYHWVGLKCSICKGYNTREVQILNAPSSSPSLQLGAIQGAAAVAAAAAAVPLTAVPLFTEEPYVAESDAASPGMTTQATGSSSARDILQTRRTIGHTPGGSIGAHEGARGVLSVFPPERFARSLSPPLVSSGRGALAGEDSDQDEEDIMGMGGNFWARVGLRSASRTRGEEEDDEEEEDGESSSSSSDGEGGDEVDDDDDEDDEISLFGHR